MMNKVLIFICALSLAACSQKDATGKFTVTGEIKNSPDQKIYLDEIYFSNEAPGVEDSAQIKNGKFTLSAKATEEGMYRLRFDTGAGFLFVNDANKIPFTTDFLKKDRETPVFNTPQNISFKKFVTMNEGMRSDIRNEMAVIANLTRSNASDSIIKIENNKLGVMTDENAKFVLTYADTTKSPMLALFALGYSERFKREDVTAVVNNAGKRFPGHSVLQTLVRNYNLMLAEKNPPADKGAQSAGMAPEITMPDTEGKTFSLSSLRGKYVLVDFWASWCRPCRGENPNVVAAYKKFKGKNFTILSVSLDKDKEEWLKAIKEDGLEWKNISDLKYWNSAAVSLYGIEGIPYNVLLDPQGKIIAKELRGDDLGAKLAEVLK